MDVLAIIPARGGSQRIGNKNLVSFAGKPLLAHTIEQALASRAVTRVVVTSDSDDILETAQLYGARGLKRPESLSGAQASSESALVHCLENEKVAPDLVVFLQATGPLRKPDDIDRAIQQLLDENSDSLLSATVAKPFMWQKENNVVRSVSYDHKARQRTQDMQPSYFENGSIYVFKPELLRETKNRLGGKVSLFEMQPWQGVDIDDVHDLELCEWLFRKHCRTQAKGERGALRDVRLFVYDFDGVMTDNRAVVSENGTEQVVVNRSDGMAIRLFREAGMEQCILSTEENAVVQRRAEKLKIPCTHGCKDKLSTLKNFLLSENIEPENVCYVGNDINDFEAMKWVGHRVAPADAHEKILQIATLVTQASGGEGVIREIYDQWLAGNTLESGDLL